MGRMTELIDSHSRLDTEIANKWIPTTRQVTELMDSHNSLDAEIVNMDSHSRSDARIGSYFVKF